jgi:protein TonB
VPPPPKDEKIHEMKQKTTAPKQTVSTTQFLPPKATSDPVTEEPAKISEMKDPGRETVDIQEGGQITIAEPFMKKDGSGVAAVTEDTGIHEVGSIDIEPEPVGGMAAWNKFLQKNMRYPTQAADAGKSGKVYLSFVVEKDGSITDVKVVRSPGFGMDDEATRVLKLAPLWKPGVQHGQKVRVRYMLPFNFQLDQ